MKILLNAIAAFALVLSFAATAQTTEEIDDLALLEEICRNQLCRSGTVTLKGDDGSEFSVDFDVPLPIVQNDWVTVFPGDDLFIEGNVVDGALVNLRALEIIADPSKTLILRFWQESRKEGGYMMMLSVQNPFPELLKYHAVMMLPDDEGLLKTSSCPVLGDGRSAFEMWPHPIFQLGLFDFRFIQPKDGEMTCEF